MFDYKPVVTAKAGPYFGAALVGTYSTIIGWNFDKPALRKGLKGFAIRRTTFDRKSGEQLEMQWLGGYKRFRSQDDGRVGDVGSLTAPFQRFRWNEYTLHVDRSYRYEVFPMRGRPGNLTRDEPPLVFEFSPTPEDDGKVGVYVNRGVTAAKAYFDHFMDAHPSEVDPPEAAYNWLSRGLKKSLLDFIEAAKPGDALHVAVYEFHDEAIALAFKKAIAKGVSVTIVHDAKAGKPSTRESDHIVEHAGLKNVVIRRTAVNISHNKLVVHLRNGKAVRVWTGSANFSENAFHYQTNTGLVIHNKNAAKLFEKYFQGLVDDPSKAESQKRNRILMDKQNAAASRFSEKAFFSPIKELDILDVAVDLIAKARSMVLVSAPFGVDQSMLAAMKSNPHPTIEYGLANATAKAKIKTLQHHSTRFFPPNKLKTYNSERWDAKAFGAHKIHAKTIIVDPYGDNPKVLIGSANFSAASCRDNDENALLIVGDKRLAAILTTEFMRMYEHYRARYYIDLNEKKNRAIRKKNQQLIAAGKPTKPEATIDRHLKEDDTWSDTSFNEQVNSRKFRDRIGFAGQ